MEEKIINLTRNYEKFKMLKGNRSTSPARIKKIQTSIMNVGYITSPILVNENMEIIDGQGRFEALKGLKLPIEYIIQPGISLKECQAMNIYQSNWKLIDYINSYAEVGNQNYIRLKNLLEEYSFNKSAHMLASACKGATKFSTKLIMDGNIELTEEEYKFGKEGLELIKELYKDNVNVPGMGRLIQGVLICRTIPGIDISRLIEKVKERLENGYIPNFSNMPDTIKFLEDIYNVKIKYPVYIFTEYRKKIREINRQNIRKLIEKNKTMSRIIKESE